MTTNKTFKHILQEYMMNFIKEYDVDQMFALFKEIEELSQDRGSGSSTSVQPVSSTSAQPVSTIVQSVCCSNWNPLKYFNLLIMNRIPSLLKETHIENIGVSIILLPKLIFDIIKKKKDTIGLGVGVRFCPGHEDAYYKVPLELDKEHLDKFISMSKSLGLTYIKKQLVGADEITSYCGKTTGFRGCSTSLYANANKVLVEIMTYCSNSGRYGRFFILVCLGVSCTVWYVTAPGVVPGTEILHPPDGELFGPYETYQPFWDMKYKREGLKKLYFLQTYDFSQSVVTAMMQEKPFSELIPDNANVAGPVLKGVAMGIILGVFLSLGIIPDVSSNIEI